MSEQKLQSKILKYLQARGCYTVKVITASKAGVPDILACCEGTFYGIEVKYGSNKPSALQTHNLEEIKRVGGKAILAYSLDDVISRYRE